MLRKLLGYYAGAFVVQMVTGLLTMLVDLWMRDTLTVSEAGYFQHFSVVYMVFAGPFIVGIDHALVTYVNAEAANRARFLRFFMTYSGVILAAFAAVGLAASPFVQHGSTALGLFAVGPFLITNLGLIVLRAHLDKAREFKLLLVQSLLWSVGTFATVRVWPNCWTPIIWTLVAFTCIAAVLVRHFVGVLGDTRSEWATRRPFGPEYDSFWRMHRPLWIAGMAFLANAHVINVVIDLRFGVAELARWGFVTVILTFVHKPLQLVQRAALPVFSMEKGDLMDGFRKLVRLNLIVFPLLALGLVGLLPAIFRLGTLSRYADTKPLIAITLATCPVMAVEFLVACVSMSRGFNLKNRDAHVAAALVNVPCATALIWFLGLLGAAVASALYVLVFGVAMFWFTRHDLRDYVRFAVRQLAISLLCLVPALLITMRSAESPAWLPAGVAVYLVGTWILGLWAPRHIRWALDRFSALRRAAAPTEDSK